ncbi:MAG: galactose mutarotase [Lacunisphaera sp.]|nr:galactose mutarotase [Lacunisphaera sp.]
MSITQQPFGQIDDHPVSLFTLANANGMVAKITNYGGIVTSLQVPDRSGKSADIVCGFNTLDGYFSEAYRKNSPYFGCLVGRYVGWIKDGTFEMADRLDSAAGERRRYQLSRNAGAGHIHGGVKGFDKRVWTAKASEEGGDAVLTLTLRSADGEEGYPGNVDVEVEYRLTSRNELAMRYRARTDRTTPFTMTNHTYFNLNGFADKVLDHEVQILSDRCLAADEGGIPTAQEVPVAGTDCDFRKPRLLGDAFRGMPLGFEHFYLFPPGSRPPVQIATVRHSGTGRKIEVLTTEPGMLFYTGRYTSDELQREDGTRFGQFRALCAETAKYSNGPNIPGAPKCFLHPGEAYDETTIYRFSWA